MELNQFTAKVTQLFSESIAFFFLLIPFFTFNRFVYPYWSYLFLTAMIIIVFEVGLTYLKNYFVYFPILVGVFLLMVFGLNYPALPAILWLGFMTWRNFQFDKHGPALQPFTVLMMTTILLLIGIMFFYDSKLIWLAITQVMVIIGGIWLRLLFGSSRVISPETIRFFGLSALILIGSSGILYGIYPYLRGIIGLLLSGVGFIFNKTVMGVVGLLDWLGLDLRFLEGIVDEKTFQQVTGNMGENKNQFENLTEVPPAASDGFDLNNGWTIMICFLIIVLLAAFLAKKKYRKVEHAREPKTVRVIEYSPITDSTNGDARYFGQSKPENPFRREVFEFEK